MVCCAGESARVIQIKSMKLNTLTSILAIAAFAAAGATSAHAKSKDESKLAAKAKITKEQAEKTALDKVPNGKIKEAELEEEKGRLIWSFDMATPGTKDTTEVNVDAVTGALVSVEVETAKDEAKEAKDEKKKAAK